MNQRMPAVAADQPAPWSAKAMRFALLGSALLVLIALISFYEATRFSQRIHLSQAHEIGMEISANGCTPANVTVSAGPAVFAIHNTSNRAVEWEILDGVMVLEERENIAPGFTQRLSTDLHAGDFSMTCGLLSNPHGTLHVTPSTTMQSAAAPLSDVDFIGPLSEYSVYLGIQLGNLTDAMKALSDAITAGDLPAARKAYLVAHADFMRIGPVVTLFADLDHRIDVQAAQLDKRETDPQFRGFDRIAYGLFGQDQKQSQPQYQSAEQIKHLMTSLTPYVASLNNDIDALSGRVNDVVIQPNQLASLAARWLDRIASTQEATNHAVYITDSVSQIAAAVAGTKEMYTLLLPALKTQAALAQSISSDFAAVETSLATANVKEAGASPSGSDAEGGNATAGNATGGDATGATTDTRYIDDSQFSTIDRAHLAQQLGTLAAAFRQVNPALGLDKMSSP